MRRKKDNKRVLVSPRNNRNPPKSRRMRRNYNPNQGKKKKTSRITLVLMILALVAFVVGAGIGISLTFDSGHDNDEGPHYENVTKEMTTNLNDTEPIYFEKSVDDVDFNDNRTLDEFNVTDAPSY